MTKLKELELRIEELEKIVEDLIKRVEYLEMKICDLKCQNPKCCKPK